MYSQFALHVIHVLPQLDLVVPLGALLLRKQLPLEIVNLCFSLMKLAITFNNFQVLIQVMQAVNLTTLAVQNLLIAKRLSEMVLLVTVFVLVVLPSSLCFKVPHLRIVMLNVTMLILVSILLIIHLRLPEAALRLLDQLFTLLSQAKRLLVIILN